MQINNKLNNICLNLNPFNVTRFNKALGRNLEDGRTEYIHNQSINHQPFIRKEEIQKESVFSNDPSRCCSVFHTPVSTFFDPRN